VAATGGRWQPLCADSLADYLARQPETPTSPANLAVTVAAMAARLDGLQDQVEALAARVDTLAAIRQLAAATAADPPQVGAPRGRWKLTRHQIRALRDKHRRGVPCQP
jgi:hypothetical protein